LEEYLTAFNMEGNTGRLCIEFFFFFFFFKVGVHVQKIENPLEFSVSNCQQQQFGRHRTRPTLSTPDIMPWGDRSDMYEAAEIRSTHPLYQYFPGCLSLGPEDCSDKIGCLLPRRPSATLAFQQEEFGEKALPQ
jgi:hypothetical protein